MLADGCLGKQGGPVTSSVSSVDTTAPVFAGAAAAQSGTVFVALDWQAAIDDGAAPGAIVYLVYRSQAAGGEAFAAPLATTAPGALSYTDASVAASTMYHYVVRAQDPAGNTDQNTREVSVTTPAVSYLGDIYDPLLSSAAAAPCAQSGCHDATSTIPPGSMDLSTASAAYAALYDVPSSQCTTQKLIDPLGGAQASYLLAKLRGIGLCGSPSNHMPEGGPYFSDTQINTVRAWIDQGAPNDSGAAADTVAPTFGGAVSATAQSGTSAVVAWNPASDNVTPPSGIVYLVYRAAGSGGQSFAAPLAATAAGATSYTDTSLSPGGNYYYVVRSVDQAGNVDANMTEVSVTTPAGGDTIAPAFSGATSAMLQAGPAIVLAWNAASDDVTAAADIVYAVYRATNSGGETFGTPLAETPAAVLSFADTSLSAGRTYYYVVRAKDEAGNIDANTAEVSATVPDSTPPTFGGALAATALSGTSIAVTWNAASDDVTLQANIGYVIYRGAGSQMEDFATPLATTAAGATSFSDGNLSPGGTYYYVVRAVDQAGNIDANLAEVFATTPTPDLTPPTFGGATSATAQSGSSAVIAWSPASDNVTPPSGIVYRVYRATVSGSQSFDTPQATSVAGATSYTDTSLSPGGTYYYVVRAEDQAGNADANMTEVSATTPTGGDITAPTFSGAASATAQAGPAIAVAWSAASDNVTAPANMVYQLYRANASGAENFAAPLAATPAGALSYDDASVSQGATYYYVVRAKDEAGNIDANMAEVSATVPDDTPPTFAGAGSATAVTGTRIDLAWSAASDNVTAPADFAYIVYRGGAPGGVDLATPVGTTAPGALVYTDTTVSHDTNYVYVVRAVDSAGNRDANTVEVGAPTPGVSFLNDVYTPLMSSAAAKPCAQSGCHLSATPANRYLDLSTAAKAYTNLTTLDATGCTSALYVEAGSSGTSYLVNKLTGVWTCGSGSRMPKGGPYLSTTQIATVKSWIDAGALNN